MLCSNDDCKGDIIDGKCSNCGLAHIERRKGKTKSKTAVPKDNAKASRSGDAARLSEADANFRDEMLNKVRAILTPKEMAPSKEELLKAGQCLNAIQPYNFDAWRLHADLLLAALEQLQTREVQPDSSFTILTIPLREDDLRDAAEKILRHCARFADSDEKAVSLVDEANRVRRITWL